MKMSDYGSKLADELKNYLKYKRALGYLSLDNLEVRLGALDAFLQTHVPPSTGITKEISDAWCGRREYETASNQQKRIGLLRGFCLYLAEQGYPTYVPARRLGHKPPKYQAHIFTDEELRKFFKAADAPHFTNAKTTRRDLIMPIFFRILHTSGMRAGELGHVRIGDVDLDKNTITVRMGKNRKDRIVPIHPSLIAGCKSILAILPPYDSKEDFFFQAGSGKPATRNYVYKYFRKVLADAGIPHLGPGKGPRVHDFRHTYCVRLLRKWVEKKRDLMAWFPYLQTMLGHSGFKETAYYLKLTAASFPQIRDQLEAKFPDIFEDISDDEPDFY